MLAAVPGGPDRLLYARVDLIPAQDGEPVLMELELTEPSLFLTYADGAADRLAAAILARLPGRPHGVPDGSYLAGAPAAKSVPARPSSCSDPPASRPGPRLPGPAVLPGRLAWLHPCAAVLRAALFGWAARLACTGWPARLACPAGLPGWPARLACSAAPRGPAWAAGPGVWPGPGPSWLERQSLIDSVSRKPAYREGRNTPLSMNPSRSSSETRRYVLAGSTQTPRSTWCSGVGQGCERVGLGAVGQWG